MADADDIQREVIAFLGSPDAYTPPPSRVDRHETHGALVFLAGAFAYKIKRAVKFSYMDFSTLARRKAMCEREVEVNRPHAPGLYLGVVAVTRAADGRLELGGSGDPVEYAVQMRRFADADLLGAIVARGALDRALAARIADVLRASHARMAQVAVDDGRERIQRIVDSVCENLAASTAMLAPLAPGRFATLARSALARAGETLAARGRRGLVRRCHGDLHLDNIVVLDGAPTPFDAIEFDEVLATIDVLYDLAFLLMDLDHAGRRDMANVILGHYLARAEPRDLDGLAALALFMGLRSAIRAMVGAQRAAQRTGPAAATAAGLARAYLAHAIAYLTPAPARLVAVGGLSGTGKSTLAMALAPELLPAPGALHLRSDVERKALAGITETERLPAASYTAEASARVYGRLIEKARVALAAGHTVIVDAVFAKESERVAVEAVARAAGVPFTGLWLTASRETMLARVAARAGDASDATPDVVERQLGYDPGPVIWTYIDAGAGRAAALVAARAALRPAAHGDGKDGGHAASLSESS